MAFYDYRFVTHWKIQGTPEKIFKILKDGAKYSTWWKPAYRTTEMIGPKKVRSVVRAKLPYTLDFTTELVRENPPHELEIRASGELSGTGLWKLKSNHDGTDVDFYWNVRAEKPLIRWLSFFLKPLFWWNHDWVMKVGEEGLQKELEKQKS